MTVLPGGLVFIKNPLIEEELKAGNPILDLKLLGIANQIADEARGLAPVDTGAYRDSIHANSETGGEGTGASVVSDDPKAILIEKGTEHTEAHAVFTRAAEAVTGHQVRDEGGL